MEMRNRSAKKRDRSNGYEAAAETYIKRRNPSIGVSTVLKWGQTLPAGASVLDLGCGHGEPISQALMQIGLELYGIDASRSMVAAFRKRFPQARVVNEAVEESAFFNRSFDGVVAWGLMFLLSVETQLSLIEKVASTLEPGGRFLFTSPEQTCSWVDVLTGQLSVSLGTDAYVQAAAGVGLSLVGKDRDEGNNHYFSFIKL